MKVRLAYGEGADVLYVFQIGGGPRRVGVDPLDDNQTFERRDVVTDDLVGYEFHGLLGYHRLPSKSWRRFPGGWPDTAFEIEDVPGRFSLEGILDYALEHVVQQQVA